MATREAFAAFAQSLRASVPDERWDEAQNLLRMTKEAVAAGHVTAAEQEKCYEGIMQSLFLKQHCAVAITGLSARPELNGTRGTITGKLENGRMPVMLAATLQPVKLRPCNMRPAPVAEAASLEAGSLVEVTGLTSATAAAYNGSVGEVLPGACSEGDERVSVQVHAGGESKGLRVRPANLRAARAERCLVDGEEALRAGRPRDALARADRAVQLVPASAAANLLRVRATRAAGQREPRVCQARALADAALEMVGHCGLRAVPAEVCIARSSADGDGGAEAAGALA